LTEGAKSISKTPRLLQPQRKERKNANIIAENGFNPRLLRYLYVLMPAVCPADGQAGIPEPSSALLPHFIAPQTAQAVDAPGREICNMFYVIDNFYHIFSSLYAYRSLFLSRGGDGQATAL
jgi:hypothetical protein